MSFLPVVPQSLVPLSKHVWHLSCCKMAFDKDLGFVILVSQWACSGLCLRLLVLSRHWSFIFSQVRKEYSKCFHQSQCCGALPSEGSHSSAKAATSRSTARYTSATQVHARTERHHSQRCLWIMWEDHGYDFYTVFYTLTSTHSQLTFIHYIKKDFLFKTAILIAQRKLSYNLHAKRNKSLKLIFLSNAPPIPQNTLVLPKGSCPPLWEPPV